MSDIELVIKIDEEAKQAFDCAESNDLKGCYYDHGGVVGNAIKNGVPLPKGHGDLKNVDNLKHAFVMWSMAVQGNFSDADIASIICNSPTIIEADKESEI